MLDQSEFGWGRGFAVLVLCLVAGVFFFGAVVWFAGPVYRLRMGPTSGMVPTVNPGETVLVKRWDAKKDHVRRYQLVVCRMPDLPDQIVIRRVVGLPGEQVEVRTNGLVINGRALPERELPEVLRGQTWLPKYSWLPEERVKAMFLRTWQVGTNQVFVVGDNLLKSRDSRMWGPLPLTNITGLVVKKIDSRGREVDLSGPFQQSK